MLPADERKVLALIESGYAAINEAATIDHAKDVLAFASTLAHATRAKDLNAEICVEASTMRLRAERRLGELLDEAQERGEVRRNGDGGGKGRLAPERASLADLGLTKKQAENARALAAVPAETFERAVESEKRQLLKDKGSRLPYMTRESVLAAVAPKPERPARHRCPTCGLLHEAPA